MLVMTHKKTRLLVVTSSFPKYEGDGDGSFVFELASRLQNDFEVVVLAPLFRGAQKDTLIGNLRVYRHRQFVHNAVELAYGKSGMLPNLARNPLLFFVIPFFLVFQFWAIKRLDTQKHFDIVHAHWMLPQGFLAVCFKKLLRPKLRVMLTVHGSDIHRFDHWLVNSLRRFVLRNVDMLTVVSQAIKEKIDALDCSRKVFVYPMGVDTHLFTPQRKDLSIKDKYDIEGPMILYVGRLIQQKGIVELVGAMPSILNHFPGAKLVVVGAGNLSGEMASKCMALDIADSVIFIGATSQNKLPPFFATANVFILPSYSEGFGLVIVEALSSGTLTIASDLPAVRAIIEDNKTGFLLKNQESHVIARKLINVLEAENELKEVKHRGREWVINNFDWEIVATNYLKLLNTL